MPALGATTSTEILVAPSAAFELMWLVHYLAAGHPHGDEFADVEAMRKGMGAEVIAFWRDGLPRSATELIVLADRAGMLRELDFDRVLGAVEREAAKRNPAPSLLSESPAERAAVNARLERLAAEPDLRARYLDLLRRIWSAARDSWAAEGRAATLAESDAWARELSAGTPYMQVLRLTHLWPARSDLDELANAASGAGRLVLTPCWFGGKVHIVELDGSVYAGRGVRFDEASCRQVAAEVASSIKALSDPTRVAILLRLARHPSSVTEVARQLELSQPTVSAHVQVLRDAGLLEERQAGRSSRISASEEGLRRLFAHAEQTLIKQFRD